MFDETVFLGGGSGFVSKTVIYSLLGEREGVQAVQDIFDKTYVPKEHKHYKDCRLGVSPHVLKMYEILWENLYDGGNVNSKYISFPAHRIK